jgi:HTH-type transcriptional regulator / antitoxin HigA
MTELIKYRNATRYAPDQVSPPGDTLLEVLEMQHMSQAELAERTGRPKKTINEIVNAKAAITPETALQFELVLGIPAVFWINREQQYREALARERERQSFSGHTDWLKSIPYSAMVSKGWVRERKAQSDQIAELLTFFGVASPITWEEIWQSSHAIFRQSPTFKSEPGSLAAWLRKGEIEANKIERSEYDPARFRAALHRVRGFTRDMPPNLPALLTKECGAAGVCVVFVPELPGTRAWGATRWLTQNTALLQLSLRYKTDDHFWFTFFHEAGHILLHGKRDVFLEADEDRKNEKEKEADAFARDCLIPDRKYRTFRRLGARSCAAVNRFAYEVGIAPGIVVGCLQHDKVLEHNECNDLKKPVDWIFATAKEKS